MLDNYTRECVLQILDFSISGRRLARKLDRLVQSPSPLKTCGNGPDLTCKAMFLWARGAGVKLPFIKSGKPIQNAFVGGFNGKVREYCLDLHWFASFGVARSTIESWRRRYTVTRT